MHVCGLWTPRRETGKTLRLLATLREQDASQRTVFVDGGQRAGQQRRGLCVSALPMHVLAELSISAPTSGLVGAVHTPSARGNIHFSSSPWERFSLVPAPGMRSTSQPASFELFISAPGPSCWHHPPPSPRSIYFTSQPKGLSPFFTKPGGLSPLVPGPGELSLLFTIQGGSHL